MAIKTSISGVLRKWRLIRLAEWLRFLYEKKKNRSLNKQFRRSHPGIVLPPDYFVYETYRLNLSEYYYDGKQTASEVIDQIQKVKDLSVPNTKILDWGCGPGRITRHLPSLLPKARLYATDYNKVYVDWCRQHLPGINFSVNTIDPPLNYPSSFFDAVIGISIFTHLSEKNHKAWIDEWYRVLKPGGILFITTQGRAYRQYLTAAELKQFDSGNLVVREQVKEGNRLFAAFQPAIYMTSLLANRFEILSYMEGVNKSGPVQDHWLLRRAGK